MVEISLGIRRPIVALVYQPDIDHIHRKERYIELLQPIFSTQISFDVKNFLAEPIVPIDFPSCAVIELFCDWLWYVQINHIGI